MKKSIITFLFSTLLILPIGFAQIEIEFEDEPVKAEAPPTTSNQPATVELDDSMGLTNRATVEEADESMAKGIQPVLIVTLEVDDDKLANKVWKNYMKDYGAKTKRAKGGNGETLSAGADMVGINGIKPVDVYAKSQTGDYGNTEVFVWFDLGDEFLDKSNRSAYEEAEAMLLKFAHEVKIEHTRNELKNAEKDLKDFNNDKKKLERQNENYHREIEDAEKRIEEAKANIVKNEEQQVETVQKIDLQKMLVEEIERRLDELKEQ